MYDHTAALERKGELDWKGTELKKVLLEKLGWLAYVLILGSLSSALLMGISYLIPAGGELDLELKRGILKVLALECTADNVDQVFEENIAVEEVEGITLFRCGDGGVAFKFSGAGLWGPISGLVALESDLKTLKGMVILEQQETPGLGGRIGEEAFQEQFRGRAVFPKVVILSTGEVASAGNEVDGISGATMTGKALEDLLNRQIQDVIQNLEGKLDGQ